MATGSHQTRNFEHCRAISVQSQRIGVVTLDDAGSGSIFFQTSAFVLGQDSVAIGDAVRCAKLRCDDEQRDWFAREVFNDGEIRRVLEDLRKFHTKSFRAYKNACCQQDTVEVPHALAA